MEACRNSYYMGIIQVTMQRNEEYKMTRMLVEKAKRILDGLEYEYFDTVKPCDENSYDDYYLYFSHPNF
jgi:formylmethanofuran dehydrogenase subunit E-like metal-binding protein